MLQALLFDMNGVVVDDMGFHERAWIALAARYGKTLTLDEFRQKLSGRRNRDNLHYLFGDGLSEAEMDAHGDEKEAAYRAAFRPHLAALPGLAELLDSAREAGKRLAVATSAPPENIDFVLDGLDLRRRFDAVVGEAEVKRSKPDPEIYLTAAARLGVEPGRCLVFEDSLAGVASGRAAGMPVVGLTTTHVAAKLKDCALAMADFRGLTIAALERVFEESRAAPPS
jgi:beta-phosphoglucomutase family hydrolase